MLKYNVIMLFNVVFKLFYICIFLIILIMIDFSYILWKFNFDNYNLGIIDFFNDLIIRFI